MLYLAALRVEAKLYAAMPSIEQGLSELDPSGYYPPGYWVGWLRRKQDNFLSYLQIYAYIISMAIPESKPDFASLRLLDFGGGWGLMGLVAREAGIGQVTYLDKDPGVSSAARVISEGVGLPFDDYIHGGEEALLTGDSNRFDSIVSSDVLEHVYDIDGLFKAVSHACSPNGFMFHQTGANPKSPYQRYHLTRLHRKYETDNPAKLSTLHAQGGRAHWEERKEFIQSYAPDITDPELETLAKCSRGLDRTDLQRAVDQYSTNKILPVPDHPTNTCTLEGYWYERLMDPYEVIKKMNEYDFNSRLCRTYWGPGRSPFGKRLIKNGLNFTTYLSTRLGMLSSFYYGVQGVKRETQ